MKKVTIRDVAKHAGVSVASVSYVLNNVDKITPETKKRILNAIKELDYKPNMMARGLSNGKSGLIGICLPITEKGDIPGDLLENNPFFSEFISGIEYTTRNKGYDILISGLGKNMRYKDWIQRRMMDGLIILGVYPKNLFEEIKGLDIPIVLSDAYEEYAMDFHRVMINDELGGYIATKHLIDLGHKRIAFVSGSIKNSFINRYRYQGYVKALKEAGIKTDKSLIFEEHVTFNGGYSVGEKMRQSGCNATAVFVAADIMAIGLLKSYIEANYKVPEDLSIIGFDNIKFAQYSIPGLTTVKQDIFMKGRISAEMILNDLEDGKRTNHSVILQPELIIRESTAPPKKNR